MANFMVIVGINDRDVEGTGDSPIPIIMSMKMTCKQACGYHIYNYGQPSHACMFGVCICIHIRDEPTYNYVYEDDM